MIWNILIHEHSKAVVFISTRKIPNLDKKNSVQKFSVNAKTSKAAIVKAFKQMNKKPSISRLQIILNNIEKEQK